MDGIIPIIALILIFSPKLVKEIKEYLLKKEQIKADTELKAEALRLKNSLELEKFINDGKFENAHKQTSQPNAQSFDMNNDQRHGQRDSDNTDDFNVRRNTQYEKY